MRGFFLEFSKEDPQRDILFFWSKGRIFWGFLEGERREDFFSRGYVKERGFSGRREVTEAFKF